MTQNLPPELAAAFDAAAQDWTSNGKVALLWKHNAGLWPPTPAGKEKEAPENWLGWLGIVAEQATSPATFAEVAKVVKDGGFRNVVLLGMGGSSLCPEVFTITFGQQAGFPALHVLDSTDPAQVRAVDAAADPKETLYIVASKSGTTLEPNVFYQYFFARARNDGRRFIAITDPESKMAEVATTKEFVKTYFGLPSIGGRFSALSNFGMVPAAAMGLDVPHLLARAAEMVEACRESDAATNPGVSLGLSLGTLARQGRDKVTLVASPAIHDLGAWLEQLIAESTGKDGTGLIPVDREPLGEPGIYGADRVFVYIRFTPHPDAHQDAAVAVLEAAGQPVLRIAVHDRYDIGAEFFRWEIATAVAGSVLGINPFNQPDVEDSKIGTRAITDEYKRTGSLPAETPILEADGLKFFTDSGNAAELSGATAAELLRSHFSRIGAGDYFALLAYIQMTAGHEETLSEMRMAVRDSKRVATCLGFGPRFLHSTGQAYKGGPASGVFLQVTCDDANDVEIPGEPFTFGIVKAAQARGDFGVLAERGRRALRVHLPADLEAGLAALGKAVRAALA